MDPLSAIGLASNILEFVEFGVQLCKGIHEVANSVTGLTAENEHINVSATDLKKLADELSTDLKGNSKQEAELVKLSGHCRDLSAELMNILSKLKAKKGDRLWSNVRAAWKSTVKGKKIVLIEKRLENYRAQIVMRLNVLLYNEQSPIKEHLKRIEQQAIDLGNQHGVRLQAQHDLLRDVLQRVEAMQVENAASSGLTGCNNAMQEIRTSLMELRLSATEIPRENDILRALYFPSMFRRDDAIGPAVGYTYRWLVEYDDSSQSSEGIESRGSAYESDTEGSDAGDFHTNVTLNHPLTTEDTVSEDSGNLEFRELNSQGLSETRNSRLGQGKMEETGKGDGRATPTLYDDSIPYHPRWDREENILRREVAGRFKGFLRHGNSVFFIHGKAGSGKSTLMKYLADPENIAVRQKLQKWAEGCCLISASVFFWNAGDRLQRSLEGLYRSILYQALRKCPEMANEVFEHTLGMSHWQDIRLPLLEKAVNKLIQTLDPQRHKLCLFIDGLDEYEGDNLDQVQLVRNIRSWGDRGNIKIICSARPHLEYMQAFAGQEKHIRLDELTRGDIFEYAMTCFQDSAEPSENPSFSSLANDLSMLAEGVFLWAYLIVRTICLRMQMYSTKQLHKMLLATPRNLDSLFDQMLEKVDPLAQEQTEKFLLLAAHNPYEGGLNAISFSWMEDLENPEFPFENDFCCYSNDQIERRMDRVHKQIRDLTRGMLEIKKLGEGVSREFRPYTNNAKYEFHPFFYHRVEFFHRTFRDYLLARWHDRKVPAVETYVRIALAEAKFSCTMDFYETGGSFEALGFGNLDVLIKALHWLSRDEMVLPINLCKEIENVFDGYEELLNSSVRDRRNNPSRAPLLDPQLLIGGNAKQDWYSIDTKPALRPFSTLNFLAYWGPVTSPYVEQRIMEHPNPKELHESLVDTFMGAYFFRLEKEAAPSTGEGVTPNSEVTAWLLEGDQVQASTVSAWLAVLGIFTVISRRLLNQGGWQVIEKFLRAGADSSVVFLFISVDDQDTLRYFELSELINMSQPANTHTLRQLLNSPATRAGKWWNGVANMVSTWTMPQTQPNYIEEAQMLYKKATAGEIRPGMIKIMEVRTRTCRLPRNFLIQLY
ncbi:hypothetical protein BJX76DRAFT_365056 [Aspergillus varians]